MDSERWNAFSAGGYLNEQINYMEKILHYADANIAGNLLIIKIGEGLPTQLVYPGIGESKAIWKDGKRFEQFPSVKEQLEAIFRRVIDANKMTEDAQSRGYNIVALGADMSYTKAEILGSLKYAKNILKSNHISLLDHSNGGYGWFTNIDEESAGYVDAVVSVSMGPARNAKAAEIIARLKIPNWFIVSNLDTKVNGDLGQVTENWHNSIINAGGVSYLTIYDKTESTNEHSILNYVWLNPARWAAKGNAPTPKMKISEFLLSNNKQKNVSPEEVYKAPATEIPVPEPPIEEPPVVVDPVPQVPPPVVIPPANKIEILYVLQNAMSIKSLEGTWENNTNITVHYADGSAEKVKIPEGYRNAGTWEDKKRGTYTLDIIKVGSKEKGTPIIIGPYKKAQ